MVFPKVAILNHGSFASRNRVWRNASLAAVLNEAALGLPQAEASLLLRHFLSRQPAMQQAAKPASKKRRYPEKPKLLDGPTSDINGCAGAPCGVDRIEPAPSGREC